MDYSEVDSPTGAVLLVITLGAPCGPFRRKPGFINAGRLIQIAGVPYFGMQRRVHPLLCFPQTAKGFLIRLARENWRDPDPTRQMTRVIK